MSEQTSRRLGFSRVPCAGETLYDDDLMLCPRKTAVGALGVVISVVISGTTGCGPASTGHPATESQVPTGTIEDAQSTPPKNPWENCYSTFRPTGNSDADLAHLVRDCGPTGGMRAMTDVRIGTQSEEDPVDRYTFEAPLPGKCYRVYAAADSGVKDLDLLLRGPSGDAVVADVTHDSWPVLPPREPVCFPQPGLYMLEVSVYRGSGRYALQVWGR